MLVGTTRRPECRGKGDEPKLSIACCSTFRSNQRDGIYLEVGITTAGTKGDGLDFSFNASAVPLPPGAESRM